MTRIFCVIITIVVSLASSSTYAAGPKFGQFMAHGGGGVSPSDNALLLVAGGSNNVLLTNGFNLCLAATSSCGGSGPTYTGPGDLSINSSVMTWWGFRCYSSTYAGNVAAITDSNSGTPSFTMSCATGGVLSATNGAGGTLATLVADCNSSHAYCTVSNLYDQSGKTNCSSSACNMATCTGTCQVLSNCPSFTASAAFCFVAKSNGYLQTSGTFTTTPSGPFSFIALQNTQAISGDDFFLQLSSSLGANTTQYRYTNNAGGNLLINLAPSGWQVQAATDNNSAVATSYMQLNNGTNSTSGVLGTTTFGGLGGLIYLGPNSASTTFYIEEAGIWSADIHTSFTSYYSNASSYLGGF